MDRKDTETSIELRKLIINHRKNGVSLREISEIVNGSMFIKQYIIKQNQRPEIRIENKVRNLDRKLLTMKRNFKRGKDRFKDWCP